jgi:hypothetical protein
MLLATLLLALAAPQDAPPAPDPGAAVQRALAELLEMQEGAARAEWPYEGVYRVAPYSPGHSPEPGKRGEIPMGYRVGGTSIVALSLLRAPGYAEDAARGQAVARAVEFVCGARHHGLMSPEYEGGYDVRGWGYVYAIEFLATLLREERVPEGADAEVRAALRAYLEALAAIEIPGAGGWSYSRRGPLDRSSPTSPFMTGPALQALFAARAAGEPVPAALVERGLGALERGRLESGEVLYGSPEGAQSAGGQLPGSVGRMLTTEVTLRLAGRGSLARVRGAIDAFLVHWEWLDRRRAQTGTHVAPYGVAPYYFYYAHEQAARAIELLPEAERGEYRRRLHERLFAVQQDSGLWNDRVFERTANYGTACAVQALVRPALGPPPSWRD